MNIKKNWFSSYCFIYLVKSRGARFMHRRFNGVIAFTKFDNNSVDSKKISINVLHYKLNIKYFQRSSGPLVHVWCRVDIVIEYWTSQVHRIDGIVTYQ